MLDGGLNLSQGLTSALEGLGHLLLHDRVTTGLDILAHELLDKLLKDAFIFLSRIDNFSDKFLLFKRLIYIFFEGLR